MVAHDEIDDALVDRLTVTNSYSQRVHVERMVYGWYRDQNAVCSGSVKGIIIALDSLGLLDRAKVREEFMKRRDHV